MQLNRAQVAEMLQVDVVTVDQKVRRGMPYVERGAKGRQWIFDSAAIIQWEKDQAVSNAVGDTKKADTEELKRRKLAAETTIAEIEAAKVRGEVAELHAVEREWSSAYAAFRARMMQIPARVATSLIGETDERAIKSVLSDEIEEALRTMGEAGSDDDSDD
jgi:phage terminase Nu1 subunit (DNA packaging protein)